MIFKKIARCSPSLSIATFTLLVCNFWILQRLISYSPFVMATTDLSYDPVGLAVGLVFIIIVLICAVVAIVLAVYFYR